MEFGLAWLALVVLGGAGYVLFRFTSARSSGEDANAAGRRALSDALPVVGAGIAGFVIFFAICSVIVILVLLLFLASLAGGGDADGLALSIVLLLLLALVVLIGLPVGAMIWVVRRRHRGAPKAEGYR